jgi:hypothetical protein
MSFKFKFNAGPFSAAMKDLGLGIEYAAHKGMEEVVSVAEMDAQAIQHWQEEGQYEVAYPSGTTWTWTVTDMARSSITGYVVPNKRLKNLPSFDTTSYRNGQALRHPHGADDNVTQDHQPQPHTVIGIVTMNVAYAPYLQAYELGGGELPVTVEVFEQNWSRVYVPSILRPAIERYMQRIVAKYT